MKLKILGLVLERKCKLLLNTGKIQDRMVYCLAMKGMIKPTLARKMEDGIPESSLPMLITMVNGMILESRKSFQPMFRILLKFHGWLLIMELGSIWLITIHRFGQIQLVSLVPGDPGFIQISIIMISGMRGKKHLILQV